MYKEISANPDLPRIEKEIREFWDNEKIFEESVKMHNEEYVFYDGPPFPTGSPHHGTIFVSILKDAVARFRTMSGKSVPRVWGWDCHGLPIENAVEKQLEIKDKQDIEKKIGVGSFNDACRKLVSGYNDAWEEYINRIGRWVDYKNPYRTLDRDFMESVIWVFAQNFKKGLIYKDYRVTPYCYHCQTSLSVSDTRESDSTRPRNDPAVFVKLYSSDFNERETDGKPVCFLAWTTTPWTLPSNLLLAVGRDMDYVMADCGSELCIIAKESFAGIRKLFPDTAEVKAEYKGKEFDGKTYRPLFSFFADTENGFKVVISDHVNTEEGTGIVHIAPAFGEDDYWIGRRNNVPVINPVQNDGTFSAMVPDFQGLNVHDSNRKIISSLEENGSLFYSGTVNHNYPHCWRCRTPLIYRAMDAWYFNVEKIKSELIEQNRKINWIPETVKSGRFGKWLEGARDWNISRNRYWGTPLPVWECENPDCGKQWVPSSCREIEEKSGTEITDLHIEFIDPLEIRCECGDRMKRTPEVLDGWFESGAMPFGQCHYPFENSEWFDSHFPADFIIEYPGQIRGWFYYLHVLAVATLGKPSFRNCLVHGTLLAADGKKLSKSIMNYTDPMELLDRYGADAMRLYLINSNAAVLGDLKFADSAVRDQVKEIILPLLNIVSFFTTYANIDNLEFDPENEPDSSRELDKWILARLSETVKECTDAFSGFYMNKTLTPLTGLIEDISNWYIRRSRSLFWEKENSMEKLDAYSVLYFVIIQLLKLLAPAAPFISEYLYKNLTGRKSVHLDSWPDYRLDGFDELIRITGLVKKIASLGLSLRQTAGIKVRQPLKSLSVCLPDEYKTADLSSAVSVLKDELNVKKILFPKDTSGMGRIRALPDARVLGPIYGKEVQEIIANAKAGKIRINGDRVEVFSDRKTWDIDTAHIKIEYTGSGSHAVIGDSGIVISMDTKITPELADEGMANDLNRIIQDMRKEAGYKISDRILLQLDGELNNSHKKRIADAALAKLHRIDVPDKSTEVTLQGRKFYIAVRLDDM